MWLPCSTLADDNRLNDTPEHPASLTSTTLPTALLLHTTRTGWHHDWLVSDPSRPGDDEAAMLWTARVGPATWSWRALGGFTLTPIAPHRRVYLGYEGAISRGRGVVRRVDEGQAWVEVWSAERAVVRVRMRGFAGRLELRPVAGDAQRWRAAVVGG